MVQIQIDLTEEQNKKIEIYKAIRGLVTKEEAIKEIIDDIKFETKSGGKELVKKRRQDSKRIFG